MRPHYVGYRNWTVRFNNGSTRGRFNSEYEAQRWIDKYRLNNRSIVDDGFDDMVQAAVEIGVNIAISSFFDDSSSSSSSSSSSDDFSGGGGDFGGGGSSGDW